VRARVDTKLPRRILTVPLRMVAIGKGRHAGGDDIQYVVRLSPFPPGGTKRGAAQVRIYLAQTPYTVVSPSSFTSFYKYVLQRPKLSDDHRVPGICMLYPAKSTELQQLPKKMADAPPGSPLVSATFPCLPASEAGGRSTQLSQTLLRDGTARPVLDRLKRRGSSW
jgi:hypothetical protein